MQRVTVSRQRGLALITAMLVVAIAATTAVYLSLDQQIWLRQAQNLSDRAQAEVVRAGAEEWAITILDKDARDNDKSDDLTENWAKPLPPIPVEGGQVTGRIIDAQSKFNLNNLVRNNQPSTPDVGTFQHLLQSLSLDPNLTDAVIDWIDENNDKLAYGAEDIDYLQLKTPYRAANRLFTSVDELRLVRGFTPEMVEKLRPWITVLPQTTEINVNTASKEVLSALFYTVSAPVIERIIAQRPYTDPGGLTQKVPELAAAIAKTTFGPYGIKSGYFEVAVETLFGRYRRTTVALIHRAPGGGTSSALWHSQLMPMKVAATPAASTGNSAAMSGGNI